MPRPLCKGSAQPPEMSADDGFTGVCSECKNVYQLSKNGKIKAHKAQENHDKTSKDKAAQ